MINSEIITLNELNNDGSEINLYYNRSIGVWTAFGLSAYALRLFGKTYSQDNPRGYSEELQMPCTVADKRTLDKLIKQFDPDSVTDITTVEILRFKISDTVDLDAYQQWAHKLKMRETNAQELDLREGGIYNVPGVPRHEFIKDGMSGFARNSKRMVDCGMSFVAMIVFSPLFLLCWAAIRLEDRGPAIFRQERIGRFGKPFYIYKFRSMRLDAEKMGPQLSKSCGEGDPRLTKVGRFIRAHHLDELPQLFNVFIGDMAFIGPRPERKFYIDQIMEYDRRYEYLYQIRPGVTSYATLYNGYCDNMAKMLRRLEYDLYYLGHRSWWLDFKILSNTFCSIVFGKKF